MPQGKGYHRPKGPSGQNVPQRHENPGVRDNANSQTGHTVGQVIEGGQGVQPEMGQRSGFTNNPVVKGPKPQ